MVQSLVCVLQLGAAVVRAVERVKGEEVVEVEVVFPSFGL